MRNQDKTRDLENKQLFVKVTVQERLGGCSCVPFCQCDGRITPGVPLSKLMKEHDPDLHKEWEGSWDAVINQRAIKERPIEKSLQIMNRSTDERTEYKKRSFKEQQAVKSIALEFMQKRSGQ